MSEVIENHQLQIMSDILNYSNDEVDTMLKAIQETYTAQCCNISSELILTSIWNRLLCDSAYNIDNRKDIDELIQTLKDIFKKIPDSNAQLNYCAALVGETNAEGLLVLVCIDYNS